MVNRPKIKSSTFPIIGVLVGVAILTLVIFFYQSTPAPSQPKSPEKTVVTPPPRVEVEPQTITVYVTRTGSKYHRGSCRYLRQSRIPMELKKAAKRYGPCSVCNPPTP